MLMRVLVTISVLCTGCLSGNLEYAPPHVSPPAVANTVTVERSLETVWKELVPALGTRFFVINNLDRTSGLINVSYSGDPEKYVDCGQIESWVDNARGKRTYSVPGPSSRPYEFKGPDGNLYQGERKMTLEGRLNLILEELAPAQTRMTVTTRYVVTRNLLTRRIDLPTPTFLTDTIAFNSGQRAEFPQRSVVKPLTCQPTGRLERDVLDLLTGR